ALYLFIIVLPLDSSDPYPSPTTYVVVPDIKHPKRSFCQAETRKKQKNVYYSAVVTTTARGV
ncbi:MAG: hypothetical protein EA426_16755, partial [Spirochaetaceae bacterium]